MTFYAFPIIAEYLPEFLQLIQKGDDMGGNEVTGIDKLTNGYLVIFKRKFSYPYIIIEIEKFSKGRRP
jgi:hypothetical protein